MNAEYFRELEDCLLYICEMGLITAITIGFIVCILLGLWKIIEMTIKGEW